MEINIITLKSYGDFLIAYASIKRAISNNIELNITIIANYHIRPLAEALDVPSNMIRYIGFIDDKEVPAIFDIRKRGLLSAIFSMIKLRSDLSKIFNQNKFLLFDRLGIRERIIAGNNVSYKLNPNSKNIYTAYSEFLNLNLKADDCNMPSKIPNYKNVIIVPGSRVKQKIIPNKVIIKIINILRFHGLMSQVLVLDQENFQLPDHIATMKVDRNFRSLISSLNKADLLVCADSLSAHIGEYLNIPVFVVSPVLNPYWLPSKCYAHDLQMTFEDISPLNKWISSLLE